MADAVSLALVAYQNQRFQLTSDVTRFATLYPSLIASAVWHLQVRPFPGSPVVTLDFKTGGSPQDAHLTATYNASPKTVTFRAPAELVALIDAQTYSFDFGFTLTGADFERVDGGTIEFRPGVTLAPVAGSPAAPSGADDTVLVAT